MRKVGQRGNPDRPADTDDDATAVMAARCTDPSKLTPLSPEVISRQATINIGTIGHVAHGKSTVVKAISGVQTVRFKNELVRNITIKLGYANAKIYKCSNEACPRPGCYRSYPSNKEDNPPCERPGCGSTMKLLRHVSFVDCPGHDILMATMLNGAAVMDAALLLVAGNESCPQPQTSEHLAAVEIMKLEHIIILQNKVDLIRKEQAEEHWGSIARFVKGEYIVRAPQRLRVAGQLCILTPSLFRRLLAHRHCCRRRTHRTNLSTAQVQHRRRQRISRQASARATP